MGGMEGEVLNKEASCPELVEPERTMTCSIIRSQNSAWGLFSGLEIMGVFAAWPTSATPQLWRRQIVASKINATPVASETTVTTVIPCGSQSLRANQTLSFHICSAAQALCGG
jgi:hypothetical protein